jgi:hypothetical protein
MYSALGFAVFVLFLVASLVILLSLITAREFRWEGWVVWLALTFFWAYGAYRYLKTRDFDEAFSWLGDLS